MLGLGLGVDRGGFVPSFLPSDLANLAAWYKADAGITTVSSAVSVWADQSGSGLDLTQGIAASRPAYGSETLNGFSVLSFDNLDDELNGSYPNDFFGVSDLTIFTVQKAAAGETGAILQKRNLATDGNIGIGYITGKPQFQTRDTGTGDIVINTTNTYNDWIKISVGRDENGIYMYSPEVITSLGSAADLTSTGTFSIGQGASYGYLNGSIAEIIIYKRLLSDTERAKVDDYLQAKWAL